MLLKRGTGSGERGAGSGERGTGNGERKSGNELSAETSIKIQNGRVGTLSRINDPVRSVIEKRRNNT